MQSMGASRCLVPPNLGPHLFVPTALLKLLESENTQKEKERKKKEKKKKKKNPKKENRILN